MADLPHLVLPGRGRSILIFLFWIWGGIGLILNFATITALHGEVGVGTSAYILVGENLWIGGMVLFGIGALLASVKIQMTEPKPGPPESPWARHLREKQSSSPAEEDGV